MIFILYLLYPLAADDVQPMSGDLGIDVEDQRVALDLKGNLPVAKTYAYHSRPRPPGRYECLRPVLQLRRVIHTGQYPFSGDRNQPLVGDPRS